jgi:hypothetical protein
MRGARACISKLFPLSFCGGARLKVCSQPGSALRTKSCDVNMAVKDKHLRHQPHQHTGNFVVIPAIVYRKRALQIFLSTFSTTTRSDEMPKRPTSKHFFCETHGFLQIEIEFCMLGRRRAASVCLLRLVFHILRRLCVLETYF